MRRPPEPHYTFTIPSLHDDTTLDCRVYHPSAAQEPPAADPTDEAQWHTQGIVMAHPYAPMGGSYDDRVVGIVVDEFLRLGWTVGTFNFRCAFFILSLETNKHRRSLAPEAHMAPKATQAGRLSRSSTTTRPLPPSSSIT